MQGVHGRGRGHVHPTVAVHEHPAKRLARHPPRPGPPRRLLAEVEELDHVQLWQHPPRERTRREVVVQRRPHVASRDGLDAQLGLALESLGDLDGRDARWCLTCVADGTVVRALGLTLPRLRHDPTLPENTTASRWSVTRLWTSS